MLDLYKTQIRRPLVRGAAAVLVLGWSTLTVFAGELAAPHRRPNVLYVFSDMQRASSLACYGDPNVRTPGLDAFAEQGTRLDVAMSNTPVCCPHRACLMTGLYSHHHGVVSNQVNFTREVRGLAEQFRDAGYVTGYAGKWHIPVGYGSEESMPLGFPRDRIDNRDRQGTRTHGHYVRVTVEGASGQEVEKEVYSPTLLTDEAICFIEEESKGEEPWLFFLSWIPPHGPYAAPEEFRRHYEGQLQLPPNVPEGLPTEYALASLPDYYGMVESLDLEFQRILDALDRAAVVEDTIVCYSSDHGDMLGSQGYKAKRWPYEESARVPFLIRYPRAIPRGRVIADPFSTVDVYPTLAGLAGVEVPDEIDGLDFSRFLMGKTDKPPRDYAFLQMAYGYVPWPGWRALRTRQYTYARTVDGPWLLYNTAKDPYQLKNLVDDPTYRSLVKEMDGRLTAIMRMSGDSWEIEATTGDLKNWIPGGPKQRSQSLGVPWPGRQIAPAESEGADPQTAEYGVKRSADRAAAYGAAVKRAVEGKVDSADAAAEAERDTGALRNTQRARNSIRRQKAYDENAGPLPTLEDVPYGSHERLKLDFWKAESDEPAPVLVFFHGGGGDKLMYRGNRILAFCLDNGISAVAVNYRPNNTFPFPIPMCDAGRAIQYLRYRADEFNIDPKRVAAKGTSLGANVSIWLACHDDIADPNSKDPVEHESSRLCFVISGAGQTFNDMELFRERVYPYGLPSMPEQGGGRSKTREEAREISAIYHVTKDDPPILMTYGLPLRPLPLPKDTPRGELIHNPAFGLLLKEKLDALGIENYLYHTGNEAPSNAEEVFIVRHFSPKANQGRGQQ